MVPVGQHGQDGLVSVFAGADLVELAMGNEVDLIGWLTRLDDDVTGLELLLDEPIGQSGQHLGVIETA